jgi:hypothetical protein
MEHTYRVLPAFVVDLVLPRLVVFRLSDIQYLRLIQHFMMKAKHLLLLIKRR